MERRINKKVNDYIHDFKREIAEKVKKGEKDSEIINYIYEYKNIEITKEDIMKRKRVKNMIPIYERCIARRANGQQCTRRKKEDCIYCGTHSKGTPHGVINENEKKETINKKEVSAIEIKGIVYYVDNNGNVYDTEDIIGDKKNARIIAKYEKDGEKYKIPSIFD